MTVGELIDRLGDFHPNILVVVDGGQDYLANVALQEEILYHTTLKDYTRHSFEANPKWPDPFPALHLTWTGEEEV